MFHYLAHPRTSGEDASSNNNEEDLKNSEEKQWVGSSLSL
jgi:hypothetical protein